MNKFGKTLVIVVDGYGVDPGKEDKILTEVISSFSDETKNCVVNNIRERIQGTELFVNIGEDELLKLAITPTPVSLLFYKDLSLEEIEFSKSVLPEIRLSFEQCHVGEKTVAEFLQSELREKAAKLNYSIWHARNDYLPSIRRDYPTVVTKTSGVAVGYEDSDPAVQGNSETGHQQLGNLIVAAQPPLQISLSIENGEFFENHALKESVLKACNTKANLNVCILLSGEYGDDGRVHSCWNHLEAFLELCFVHNKLDPKRLRIQAILDGRDSPQYSSLQGENGKHRFLGKLIELLKKHNAVEALAWIVGRSFSMDRDYDETKAKLDYQLLTEGKGLLVADYKVAFEKIGEMHQEETTDSNIDPIVIADSSGSARCIQPGDVFVDLNFRADRQRSKIASLLNAKEFLQREAATKGNEWVLDWMNVPLNLDVYCMTEYHPDFENIYGASIAFPTFPHPHNYLDILSRVCHDEEIPFKYLLLAESTKALHVGYFIRGRREKSSFPEMEKRIIVPSHGEESGVKGDGDFYITPQMKAYEIAGHLCGEMYLRTHDLIIVNFSNPDMIGHLICDHYGAVVESIEVIDSILSTTVPLALELGYNVVVTADHGNAEAFSPAHGSNDVLTTFISKDYDISLNIGVSEKAKLFDVPWSVLEMLGATDMVTKKLPHIPELISKNGLVGKPLIRINLK